MTNRGVSLVSLACLFLFSLQFTACGGGAISTIGGGGSDASLPSIMTTSLPSGTMGAAYTANLQATGGKQPYSWSLKSRSLPAGLSLSKAGVDTGAPTRPGDFLSVAF